MSVFKIGVAAVAVGAMTVASTIAGIIVQDNWDSGTENWTGSQQLGFPQAITLTQTGGQLDISGGDGGGDLSYFVFNNTDMAGNQNWNAGGLGANEVKSVRFDFYAGGGQAPDGLSLYFRYNQDGDDVYWYYTLPTAAGSKHYDINLLTDDVINQNGWYSFDYGGGGTQSDLMGDLSDIDEVGILLTFRSFEAGQLYGLDDFTLDDEYFVPEPGTWLALGFAFVSLGITFRRRLTEALDGVRAMVIA